MPRFFLSSALVLGMSLAAARAAAPATAASAPATAPSQVQYVQLINARALDSARLINAIFSAPTASQTFAAADARTNTVVVAGSPELVARALDLLHKIDQSQDNGMGGTSVFFIYHLKQGHAAELADAMNKLFAKPASATPATTPAPASQPAPASPAAALAAVAYFVPNPDTNSVLVTTDRQFEETVRNLLNLLDQNPPAHAASQPKSDLP